VCEESCGPSRDKEVGAFECEPSNKRNTKKKENQQNFRNVDLRSKSEEENEKCNQFHSDFLSNFLCNQNHTMRSLKLISPKKR
jgi:hypothetical protein